MSTSPSVRPTSPPASPPRVASPPPPASPPPRAASPRTQAMWTGVSALALALGLVALAATLPGAWARWIGATEASAGPVTPGAVAWNLGLVLLFGIQHSGQVRAPVKRWHLARFPKHTERIAYSAASCLVLALVFAAWRPLAGVVWHVDGPAGGALHALGVAGWIFGAYSATAMNLGELSGWTAVRDLARARRYEAPAFRVPGPYRHVRHPIMLGFLVGIWGTGTLSVDRLLLGAGMTLYILVGIWLEERDLRVEFGENYAHYQRTTPMLWPRPGRVYPGPPASGLPASGLPASGPPASGPPPPGGRA